jgi:phosphate transport system protein
MSTVPRPHPHRPLLQEQLARLRALVAQMGELVHVAIARAMVGLASRDVDACAAVIAEDARLNALHRDARDLCFTIVLTQGPRSCDLRETMSLLHMASELERMGDHCVSIAKIGRDLADLPELPPHLDLSGIARSCADQVRDVLTAVIGRGVEEARRVAARDDDIDLAYRRVFDHLVTLITKDAELAYPATKLVLIAHHFERIADRVTNIAEDLVFLETGVIEELG